MRKLILLGIIGALMLTSCAPTYYLQERRVVMVPDPMPGGYSWRPGLPPPPSPRHKTPPRKNHDRSSYKVRRH